MEYSTNYYDTWYPHIPKRKPNTISNKQSLVESERDIWNKQTNLHKISMHVYWFCRVIVKVNKLETK